MDDIEQEYRSALKSGRIVWQGTRNGDNEVTHVLIIYVPLLKCTPPPVFIQDLTRWELAGEFILFSQLYAN